MTAIVVLFIIIYVVNVIPAFAPPTWIVLSLFSLNFPTSNVPLLAIVGAGAATLGRFSLAKLSRVIVRRKLLSEGTRQNIDVIKIRLEHRRVLTISTFFFYALSPLPSNYLFIAYGLTTLDFRLITVPFFVGRFASYNFFVFSASSARHHLILESPEAESYLGLYFVISQLLLLSLVYLLAKIDCRQLLKDGKVRWLTVSRQNEVP
jgi:membrane protein YqaA with SNARE-associated domain